MSIGMRVFNRLSKQTANRRCARAVRNKPRGSKFNSSPADFQIMCLHFESFERFCAHGPFLSARAAHSSKRNMDLAASRKRNTPSDERAGVSFYETNLSLVGFENSGAGLFQTIKEVRRHRHTQRSAWLVAQTFFCGSVSARRRRN